jgi:hypothetical protein
MAKTFHYLAVWDNLGLESIFDVDAAKKEIDNFEKDQLLKILKEEPTQKIIKPNPIPLQKLILRARFNSQRQYEIYEFTSTLGIKKVRELFESEPQVIVDWIRQNGHKIYSDYNQHSKQKIF